MTKNASTVDFYEANKEYLNELEDKLDDVEALSLDKGQWYRSNTGDKKWTVSKWEGHFLCSPSDPFGQAKLWAEDNYEEAGSWVYYVSGLGMGYHILELFEKLCDKIAFIVVAEKNLEIIKTFLTYHDLTRILNSGRFYLIRDNDREKVFKTLGCLKDMPQRGVKICSPLTFYDTKWQKETMEMVRDYCDHARTGACTMITNAAITYENVLSNLLDYLITPSFEMLKDWFKNIPAIIVGAGPSVDNELDKLTIPKYRSGYVLFATPTMLKPLLKIGRKPHFICALDYAELSGRFYEGLKIDSSIIGIFETKANRAVIEGFTRASEVGINQMAFLSNEFIDWSIKEIEKDHPHPRVSSGTTVAHLCLNLAVYMGCDPIIHIGQDLAFTEGRYYSEAVNDAFEWKKDSAKRANPLTNPYLRQAKGKQGKIAWMDEQFHSYSQQFELIWADLKKKDHKVYDCSSLGLVKENCENADFVEILDKYVAPRMLKPLIFDYLRLFRTHDYKTENPDLLEKALECLQKRCEEIKAFQKVNKDILKIIEKVDPGNTKTAERVRKKLDKLQERVTEMGHARTLVANFSGKGEIQRERDDDTLMTTRLSGTEKLTSQKDRDMKFIPEMISSCERLLIAFNKAIKELQR